MKINRKTAGHLAVVIGLMVGGGFVAKHVSPEAGVAMIALGASLGGVLVRQPDYAK